MKRRGAAGATVTLALAVAFGAAGCGAAEDQIAEAVAEKAVEEGMEAAAEGEGGGEVDIEVDEDGGEMTVETSEGALTMGGGEVPESFPDDVPLPEADYEVVSAMEVTGAEGFAQVSLSVPDGTVDDVLAHVEPGMSEAGYAETSRSEQSVDDERLVNLVYEGDGKQVAITISSAASDGNLLVGYRVMQAEQQ